MPAPQPASRYDSQPASRIVLPPSAVPLRILRNQSVVSAGLFLWKSKKEQAVIAHDSFVDVVSGLDERLKKKLGFQPDFRILVIILVGNW